MIELEKGFYYCLTHHAVEPYDGCKADDRLGPYATREEAANALETVEERNEAWDTDPRFNDPADQADPDDPDYDPDDWDDDGHRKRTFGPFSF